LVTGNANGQFDRPGRRVWKAPQPLQFPFLLTAGDVDGDGHLDIWLAQYKAPYFDGNMPTPYYDANDGEPSFLLLNDGLGNFVDTTENAGLAPKRYRRTYSASFIDLDDDGDLDLTVVSDFAGVDLYYNDGHGHFTDLTNTKLSESHLFGMSHCFGDFNKDGKLDLLAIGMNSYVAQRLDNLKLKLDRFPDYGAMRSKMGYGNRMYLSKNDTFVQSLLNDQVARTGWSWGATAFDLDNDGDEDIYVANGHKSRQTVKDYEPQFWCHDIYVANSKPDVVKKLYFQSFGNKHYGRGESYGGYYKNKLFLNENGKSFLEVGYLMGVALEQDSRNVVSDDLDADGRVDLVVTTWNNSPQPHDPTLVVFRNRCENGNNWIGLHLHENGPGTSPLGAKVTLTFAEGKQIRHLVTGDSHRSQHATTVHFGLGKATNVRSVEIRWPNGKTEQITNPTINRYHEVGKRHTRGSK